jgi:hypothetical protein
MISQFMEMINITSDIAGWVVAMIIVACIVYVIKNIVPMIKIFAVIAVFGLAYTFFTNPSQVAEQQVKSISPSIVVPKANNEWSLSSILDFKLPRIDLMPSLDFGRLLNMSGNVTECNIGNSVQAVGIAAKQIEKVQIQFCAQSCMYTAHQDTPLAHTIDENGDMLFFLRGSFTVTGQCGVA